LLPDLIQKLLQLLPLALAKVKKADSHTAGIVDCLRYAREAKRQPIDAKLNLDAPEDPHGKWPVRVNATATKTDIDNVSVDISGQVDKTDDNSGINLLSRMKTTLQTWIRNGSLKRDALGKYRPAAALAIVGICHARNTPRPVRKECSSGRLPVPKAALVLAPRLLARGDGRTRTRHS
jgi:hypothetical protein